MKDPLKPRYGVQIEGLFLGDTSDEDGWLGYELHAEGTTLPELLREASVTAHDRYGNERWSRPFRETPVDLIAEAELRKAFEEVNGKVTDLEFDFAWDLAFPSNVISFQTPSDRRTP